MIRRVAPVLLLAVALTGAASKDDPFAGRIAGPSVRCIGESDARSVAQPLDDHTLVYQTTARRIWRNDLAGRCPGLDRDAIVVLEVYGAQFCQGDRFRTLQRTSSIPGPYCRLGAFTPYDLPPKAR